MADLGAAAVVGAEERLDGGRMPRTDDGRFVLGIAEAAVARVWTPIRLRVAGPAGGTGLKAASPACRDACRFATISAVPSPVPSLSFYAPASQSWRCLPCPLPPLSSPSSKALLGDFPCSSSQGGGATRQSHPSRYLAVKLYAESRFLRGRRPALLPIAWAQRACRDASQNRVGGCGGLAGSRCDRTALTALYSLF